MNPYARSCRQFFAWCEDRGLSLTAIRPFDVAAYIEGLQQTHSAPAVKQQLASVRMLFDWLVTGQIVPVNPAAAVRGPKHVGVKTRKCTLCPSRANERPTLPLPVRFIVLGRSQRLYKALIFKGSALVAASRKFGP
jgi:hypothetical protein